MVVKLTLWFTLYLCIISYLVPSVHCTLSFPHTPWGILGDDYSRQERRIWTKMGREKLSLLRLNQSLGEKKNQPLGCNLATVMTVHQLEPKRVLVLGPIILLCLRMPHAADPIVWLFQHSSMLPLSFLLLFFSSCSQKHSRDVVLTCQIYPEAILSLSGCSINDNKDGSDEVKYWPVKASARINSASLLLALLTPNLGYQSNKFASVNICLASLYSRFLNF